MKKALAYVWLIGLTVAVGYEASEFVLTNPEALAIPIKLAGFLTGGSITIVALATAFE